MSKIPKRDITGNCDEGECRDRVIEGNEERQKKMADKRYSTPNPNSPEHTKKRNEQPAVWGGRV